MSKRVSQALKDAAPKMAHARVGPFLTLTKKLVGGASSKITVNDLLDLLEVVPNWFELDPATMKTKSVLSQVRKGEQAMRKARQISALLLLPPFACTRAHLRPLTCSSFLALVSTRTHARPIGDPARCPIRPAA